MTGTLVATPYGAGRLTVAEATSSQSPRATLLLSHGAGSGTESHDLAALHGTLPGHAITVALFDQPWRVAGRKVATPPATLDIGLRAAAAVLAATSPLVVGGRSAGARSAARCAGSLNAAGCLALSFPLHPPGRPEKSRITELAALSHAGVPALVVQGERDAMGRPEEFRDDLAGVDLVVVPAADHGLKVPKRAGLDLDGVHALVVDAVVKWICLNVLGNHRLEPSVHPTC